MTTFLSRPGRGDLEVGAELTGADGPIAATTRNVGVGGVFVATDRVRPVGERVALRFALPGAAEPISVEAEVRWNRGTQLPGDPPAGMGLRFVGLPTDASDAIERFLKDLRRYRAPVA